MTKHVPQIATAKIVSSAVHENERWNMRKRRYHSHKNDPVLSVFVTQVPCRHEMIPNMMMKGMKTALASEMKNTFACSLNLLT